MDQYVREVRLRPGDDEARQGYPFTLPFIRSLKRLALHPKVTYLIGDNGAGKSTLLEAIAVAFGMNAEGGSRNFTFSTRPSHSVLHEHLLLVKGARRPRDTYFLRAESFFNLASNLDEMQRESGGALGPYGGVSLHEQSHGESFWALFSHRFGGRGLYILDEPEAALSPKRQIAFLGRMHELIEMDSQFIVATHSPIVMAYPDAWIYEFTWHGLERTTYEETEHYRMASEFFADPAAAVREALSGREPGRRRRAKDSDAPSS
ncbi:MAG: AAA family ATPase [Armatimonadetes bacterium]|nr:AAA family ATPase [Armatimonadota bacterium]